MNYELRDKILITTHKRQFYFSCVFVIMSLFSFSQVTSSIDSISIKIGEQIIYKIEVESDTTDFVVFPEGQTFQPLEMIESFKIDTTKKDAKYYLIKKYGLTQFDSGKYTIPKQKIVIGSKIFQTDSLLVEVNPVVVDTTKQGLYDIKPIIGVKKSPSYWWLYVLLILLVFALAGFLLYWFVWREKPLTEQEKEALIPPYDRAKLALQELDNAGYLKREEVKAYYSDLTLIIRKYLDEKVYDHSLESTTDELINRLQLLKDGNQIDLSKESIKNIETILKRADLVKFAKSKPDFELAKLDRNTIDVEIDHVKESLPEPTEDELLADQKYQEELAKKRKRKKVLITIIVAAFLVIATIVGFTLHFGFTYVKDTILGHPSKELLEVKEWVTSEYGAPGITITTPKVLKRVEVPIPEEMKSKIKVAAFGYGGLNSTLDIAVVSTKVAQQNPQPNQEGQPETKESEIDLLQVAEEQLIQLEAKGAQNIITRTEQFITPNGQEGLKTFGTADFVLPLTGKVEKGNYIILGFTAQNIIQQVVLIWKQDDTYADEIIDRILNSIELIKIEEEE
jgi:flagellar basal body-associated protein FliL